MDFPSLVAANLARSHRSERMAPRAEDRYYQVGLPRLRLLPLVPAAATAGLLLMLLIAPL